jgi:ferredoxin
VTRLRVDAGRCVGHGRCYELAPTLFDEDDLGYGRAHCDELSGPELMLAQQAVHACPEGAVELVE